MKKFKNIAYFINEMDSDIAARDFENAYRNALIVEEFWADSVKDDYSECHGRALDRVAQCALSQGIEIPDWFGNGRYKGVA